MLLKHDCSGVYFCGPGEFLEEPGGGPICRFVGDFESPSSIGSIGVGGNEAPIVESVVNWFNTYSHVFLICSSFQLWSRFGM